MFREDCFAYAPKKCKVLIVRDCARCSFYKTKEQFAKDAEKYLAPKEVKRVKT
jgi:hypothetical protein